VAFWKAKPYDRVEVLAAADRARARGRVKKAIAGYRKVLQADPRDAAVHGKIAPLLARVQEHEAALASFEAAARGHLAAGFADRALAVWTQAAAHYPERSGFWEEMARLHLGRERRADAVSTLVRGGSAVGRATPEAGIRLLGQALEVERWNVPARIALARLLRRTGRRPDAAALLSEVAPRLSGRPLRQVRGALFAITPTPAAAWRWLWAAVAGR